LSLHSSSYAKPIPEKVKDLFEAVTAGDETKYNALVSACSNTELQELRDEIGNTLLYEACRQRNQRPPTVVIVADLLHRRGLSVTTPSGHIGSTALHGLLYGMCKWYDQSPRTATEMDDYLKYIRIVSRMLIKSNAAVRTLMNFEGLSAENELQMFLDKVTNAYHRTQMETILPPG